jgi:hypothetical protein
MKYKPEEFYFSIQFDEEYGGYYSVFQNIKEENLFINNFIFILPAGFYSLSRTELIFGFNVGPVLARQLLKNKKFVENLDLI